MNKIRWIFFACLLVAITAALVTITNSDAKFESTSIIMLKRAQMERSGHSTQDTGNRWVWVRDGLELKNELVSEVVLKKVIAIIVTKNQSSQSALEVSQLRKQVEVHYSGGDDNLFTIRVQQNDPELAKAMAEAYLEIFPSLAIERRMQALESSLATMERSLSEKGLSAEQQSRKIDIIETIKSDITLAKSERDQRIVIIQSASPAVRIWPQPLFILVAFGCFGVFFAAVITVFLKKTKKI